MAEDGKMLVSATADPYMREVCKRRNYTWKDWDDTYLNLFTVRGVTRSHAEFVFRWLRNLPEVRPWMVFGGSTGMGKSHLATIAAKMWVVTRESRARIICWPMWLEELKHSYNNGHEVSVLDLTEVPFLVLDDLTYERTPHSLKMLYLTLEGRAEKPTIITTNIRLEKYRGTLAKDNSPAAQRIASRLGTGKGSDIRAELTFSSSKGDYRA
jgi:hypothetical protein